MWMEGAIRCICISFKCQTRRDMAFRLTGVNKDILKIHNIFKFVRKFFQVVLEVPIIL